MRYDKKIFLKEMLLCVFICFACFIPGKAGWNVPDSPFSFLLESSAQIWGDNYAVGVEDDETKGDTVKILAIGNSFSLDALEYYLSGLFRAEKINAIIGDLYIGGATLDRHWENASTDKKAYSYRKIDVEGIKTITPGVSLSEAIKDEDWDYISFQQVSHQTGQYETFLTPLPKLYDYVKERATNPGVRFVYHQSWAYSKKSGHPQYFKYDKDQLKMYNAIVDAVWRAIKLVPIDFVIPSGTAIQNGRTSSIGDHFNRDGYHLNPLGQYTASCVWFEALTGINVVGNRYSPEGLTDEEVKIAQNAAHAAIVNPKEVTELTGYQKPPVTLTYPVNIGFGSGFEEDSAWNVFYTEFGIKKGATIPDLTDENGDATGINVEITEPFYGTNQKGADETNTGFFIPAEISKYSLYGNARKARGDKELKIEESELTFSNLKKDRSYNFCFFSSRMDVSDNRETKFIVDGSEQKITSLDASNNTAMMVCTSGVEPDDSGEIKVTVTVGDNNDNPWGYYYLNAVRIIPFVE